MNIFDIPDGYMALDEEQLLSFRNSGYAKVPGVLSAEQVNALRERVDMLAAGGGNSLIRRQTEEEFSYNATPSTGEKRGPLRKLHGVARHSRCTYAVVVNPSPKRQRREKHS